MKEKIQTGPKFFHSKASQRQHKNYITRLYDANGNWCTQQS